MVENKEYIKIDKEESCVYEIMKKLSAGNVLLSLHFDPVEYECSVKSFKIRNVDYYDRDKKLYVYMPSYSLCLWQGLNEIPFEEMNIKSSQEWTDVFMDEKSDLLINTEGYCPCEYDDDTDAVAAEFEDPFTELYLSSDAGNFYGPLEFAFIKWWIRGHLGYHTDQIFTSRGEHGFFITEGGTLYSYSDKTEPRDVVVIPNGVRKIDTEAFRYSKVKEVVVPEGVKRIGCNAFEGCDQLERISLPDSLIAINLGAFRSCRSLKQVRIPPSIKVIEMSTFSGCTQLETVILPETVKRICRFAFSRCENLTTINISPEMVIEEEALYQCPQAKVPKRNIGRKRVFVKRDSYRGLLLLPGASVRTLERWGWKDPDTREVCQGLSFLSLPPSISSIPEYALKYDVETIMIHPGKRIFRFYHDILSDPKLKLVFHCGRDVNLYHDVRPHEEPLLFVSFPEDRVIIDKTISGFKKHHVKYELPEQSDASYSRYVLRTTEDLKTLVERYRLEENEEIMEYLSVIFARLASAEDTDYAAKTADQ